MVANPTTLHEALGVLDAVIPVAVAGEAIWVPRSSMKGKDDATVARFVKRTFPNLSVDDMANLADQLQAGAL